MNPMDTRKCLNPDLPELVVRLDERVATLTKRVDAMLKLLSGANGQHTLRGHDRRIHKLELVGGLLLACSAGVGGLAGVLLRPWMAVWLGR